MDADGKPTAAAIRAKQKHKEALKGDKSEAKKKIETDSDEEDSDMDDEEDEEEKEDEEEPISESDDGSIVIDEDDESYEGLTEEEKKEKKLAALAAAKEAKEKRKEDRQRRKEEREKKKSEKEKSKAEKKRVKAEKKAEKQNQKAQKEAEKAEKEANKAKDKSNKEPEKDLNKSKKSNAIADGSKKDKQSKKDYVKGNNNNSDIENNSETQSETDGEYISDSNGNVSKLSNINGKGLRKTTKEKLASDKTQSKAKDAKANPKDNKDVKQKTNGEATKAKLSIIDEENNEAKKKAGSAKPSNNTKAKKSRGSDKLKERKVGKKGKSRDNDLKNLQDEDESDDEDASDDESNSEDYGNDDEEESKDQSQSKQTKTKPRTKSSADGIQSPNENEIDTTVSMAKAPKNKLKGSKNARNETTDVKYGTAKNTYINNNKKSSKTSKSGNTDENNKNKLRSPQQQNKRIDDEDDGDEYDESDNDEYDEDDDDYDSSYDEDDVSNESTGDAYEDGDKHLVKGPGKQNKKSGGFFSSLFGGNKTAKKVTAASKKQDKNEPNSGSDGKATNDKTGKKSIFNTNPTKKVNYGDWDESNIPTGKGTNSVRQSNAPVTRVPLAFRSNKNDGSHLLPSGNNFSNSGLTSYPNADQGPLKFVNSGQSIPTGYTQMPSGNLQRDSGNMNPVTPLGYMRTSDGSIARNHEGYNDGNNSFGHGLNPQQGPYAANGTDNFSGNGPGFKNASNGTNDDRAKFNALFKTNAKRKLAKQAVSGRQTKESMGFNQTGSNKTKQKRRAEYGDGENIFAPGGTGPVSYDNPSHGKELPYSNSSKGIKLNIFI